MGITAHWISHDWKLKNTVLDFCQLEGPHSGENIASKLFEVLKDFGILKKVNIFNNILFNKLFNFILKFVGIKYK